MLLDDSIKLAFGALKSQRLRSCLTALGIAVGTVNSRLSRAREALRRRLVDVIGEGRQE